ncbi:MAG TPA: DUF981 family protein [Phormidium sp.]
MPGSFNIAFGETTVLFGILFVGTSFTLAMGWDLLTLGVYGFFAGLVSLLIGFRIINLGLIPISLPAGIGFILVGLGGIFSAPTLYLKQSVSAEYWRSRVNCGSSHLSRVTKEG